MTTVDIFINPFANTLVHPSPALALLVGVTPRSATTATYGWIQRGGPAAVLGGTATTALVINERATDHPTVDGAVTGLLLTEGTPNTAGGQYTIGSVLEVAADTEYSTIWMDMN